MIGRADIEGSKSNAAMNAWHATSRLSLCSESAVRRPKAPGEPLPVLSPARARTAASPLEQLESSPPTV
ncbi:hypothetical protein H5410_064044 [Solanum commersonii]|uniref:Uncharacterized protein n=1 Tax=Solanum commersonii TaxID=4109 RepID=A0A9J5W0V4_SOLCO|nr:hypothetical protein H5410_064044 [Solanum commersonii]